MNSNNSDKKTVTNFIAFRPTFGVICKETGQRYPDILLSFLQPLYITAQDFDIGYIRYNGQEYIIHCDRKVRRELGMEGYCKVLGSFQIRTTGAYVICRVFDRNTK
jgi:hypothetical protein